MKYSACELHCHTIQSDGSMSEKLLVERSLERGYAGIALTDHNTTAGCQRTREYCNSAGIAFLPGIEWTTFWGHVVVLGGHTTVDWRDITAENIAECIDRTRQQGDSVTIAHPRRAGAPLCWGCHMDYSYELLRGANAIEVWSGTLPQEDIQNKLCYPLWHELLRRYYRLAAVEGYDWHRADYDCTAYPVTMLGHTGELSGDKMLSALLQGNAYTATGIQLLPTVTAGNHEVVMSGTVSADTLCVRVDVDTWREQYTERYGVFPRAVRLVGTATQDITLPLHGHSVDFGEVSVRSGYMTIEVIGDLMGREDMTLGITSPYYISTRR